MYKKKKVTKEKFERKIQTWSIIIPIITCFIGAATTVIVAFVPITLKITTRNNDTNYTRFNEYVNPWVTTSTLFSINTLIHNNNQERELLDSLSRLLSKTKLSKIELLDSLQVSLLIMNQDEKENLISIYNDISGINFQPMAPPDKEFIGSLSKKILAIILILFFIALFFVLKKLFKRIVSSKYEVDQSLIT